ncbi:chaplin family protein [Streptomyces sp. NPDC005012]|uniref:chaplin n=1 Tax=unclassified Streptomyces TaxID=2593676 RepID=UPI0033AA4882
MRHVTRKGLMTVAAATGVIAAAGGQAHADANAGGSAANSPGVLSGNTVQVPVNIAVNVCGNTVDVIGLLNPAAGNRCVIDGGKDDRGRGGHGSGKQTSGKQGGGKHRAGDGGGAQADGRTSGSPGVISGNTVQVPVDVPVNLCGNSVNVVGLGNAAVGNDCVNEGTGRHRKPPAQPERPEQPGKPGKPERPDVPDTPDTPGTPGTPSTPEGPAPHGGTPPQLAETGAGVPVGAALPIGAGALLAGALLYRRARAAA